AGLRGDLRLLAVPARFDDLPLLGLLRCHVADLARLDRRHSEHSRQLSEVVGLEPIEGFERHLAAEKPSSLQRQHDPLGLAGSQRNVSTHSPGPALAYARRGDPCPDPRCRFLPRYAYGADMSFFWGRTVVPSKATIHERCSKS